MPMDVLPVWHEIEQAAHDGYEELAKQGLPYEQLEAFLTSPEMADETVATLAERAPLPREGLRGGRFAVTSEALAAELAIRGKSLAFITSHPGCTEKDLLERMPTITREHVDRWVSEGLLARDGEKIRFRGSW
jgi:hypothetical protein